MPSFISSSDRPHSWATMWILCIVCAGVIVGGAEFYWRQNGYVPNIRDSSQLWSMQRDRVYDSQKMPLVLLGASRIEFDIDMKQMQRLLPRYQPIMLAQNAHYPLAVLRDLADDERFHGAVLCDIEPSGLYKMYTDSQQPLVDYYHRQWSPSWRVHRWILTNWQRNADVADPDLGAVAVMKRIMSGESPPKPDYLRFYADRSGDLDYTRTDVAAAKRHFAELVAKRNGDIRADVEPDRWFADLSDVLDWTRRIEARGGRVIFLQSPTSGEVRRTERVRHPPELYWDRFAAAAPQALDGLSNPVLSAFVEADDSHLDFRDKPAYTSALVDELVKRGWLQK